VEQQQVLHPCTRRLCLRISSLYLAVELVVLGLLDKLGGQAPLPRRRRGRSPVQAPRRPGGSPPSAGLFVFVCNLLAFSVLTLKVH